MFNTRQRILNLTITECSRTINEIEKLIIDKINKSRSFIPESILENFLEFESKKYEKLFNNIKLKNTRKISKLISKDLPNNVNVNKSDWVENISNTQIPNEVMEILALGKKYALPLIEEENLQCSEYIACIESALYDKPPEIKDTIRADVVNIITNQKIKLRHKKNRITKFQKLILKKSNKTRQFIKSNPQITVLQSDKSNKTVVMNTDEYDNKMRDLLRDTNTYKKLRSDATITLQDKNNDFVKQLLERKSINKTEAKTLMTHNAISPKIYGLPKLHKSGIPLRPIVSYIQSPLYKLSKYLSNALSKITGKNDYYIKNSFTFKEFIDTVELPQNYTLLSLDVTSLYTNIPNELISNIIRSKWTLLKEHTTLSCNDFIEGINLILNNNFFQYKNEFYQQLDGCAMGAPISSTTAQLVMEFLEENVIGNLKFPILFFKRYVDDCITAVPSDKVEDLLNAFNSFNGKLQFTCELEQNNSLNFLDLTIIRNTTNKLKTKWYTKPTSSGRYLNYNSNHPKCQKLSVIIGLTDRAIALTSPEYREETLKKVQSVLTNNQYPLGLIERIRKQRIYKFYNNINNEKQKTENTTYVALPYANELSEKIKYSLAKYNITVCHKAQNMLSSVFTSLKSKVPTQKKSNLVYAIPCKNCPKKYIGMTTQYLSNRINGHKYTKNASTALHKHEKSEKHQFDFKETKIVCQDSNYHKLTIKEMIHIKTEKNAVNDKKDISNLSQIYHNLITNN